MNQDADIIVVGAGPAGSVTALLLARAGVRVLLLDRHAFPRAKPCGDCLSAGASAVLRRLGLLGRVHALPHADLRGWRIVAPDGSAFTSHFAATPRSRAVPHALAVERARLDAALLAAASEAGAEFRSRVHVRDLLRDDTGRIAGVLTADGALTARAVVGADGLRSIVATRLGVIRRAARLRKVSLTARLHAPGLARAAGEMHIGDGTVAGIAPVDAAGRCNVTVVADAARHGRAVAADPAAFAVAALAALPRLRDRMAWAALCDAPLCASGPFDRPVRRVIDDGCALVGDAAGYYDPFTGQGIHQALCSAELLAPVLLRALEGPAVTRRSLRPYALHRRRLLRAARALQHVIEAVVSRPRLACYVVARLAHAQPFADALLGVTAGLFGPSRLISPCAMSSLFAHDLSPEQMDDDHRRAVHGRSRPALLSRRR
jgi:flavin-dependent dehydrogenase